jgi:ABC-2 type transport system ATP-binding protein
MQVRALLEFFGELRGGRKVGKEVAAWLTRLDLAHCATRRVDTLSKGMSQRVQFLAAVIPEPKLLILDEPFTGLDPVSADVLRAAILDLRRNGATVILSTHDMTVAETLCDHICMIFRGRKVLDGTLASIQDQYSNDTIRVAVDGGLAMLGDLPGVEKVRDLGQVQGARQRPAPGAARAGGAHASHQLLDRQAFPARHFRTHRRSGGGAGGGACVRFS